MQVALPKGVGRRQWGEIYDEQRAKRKRARQREKNCGTTAESGGQRLRLCLALFDYPPECLVTPLPFIALFRTLCLQQLHADSDNNNNNNNSFVSRSYPAACLFGLLFAAPRAPLRRTSPRRLLRLFLTSTAENFQFLVFSLF